MKSRRIEILLISDDLDYKNHLTKVLATARTLDFFVTISANLEKSFNTISNEQFDIILLDLNLIKHNPLQLVKVVLSNSSELPVIILTQDDDVELAVNSVRYGAADYLLKAQDNAHIISTAVRYAIERQKTEKFQREQLHFLQSVMDNIPGPLALKGTDLTYGACNTAFENLTGMSKHDIIGKTVFDIFDEHNSEIVREKELSLLSSGGIEVYDLTILNSKDEQVNIVFYETTHNRADGSLAGLIGVGTDVTRLKKTEQTLLLNKENLQKEIEEQTKSLVMTNQFLKKQIAKRKTLESQLKKERNILLNGPVIIFRYKITKGNHLEYVSPNISKFGYTHKELITKRTKFYDIIKREEKKELVKNINKFIRANQDHFQQDFSLICKGTEKTAEVHAYISIIRDRLNNPIYIDGYVIDISTWEPYAINYADKEM